MEFDDTKGLPRIPELEEDYELVRELGRDGTTVLYLARERTVDRSVAIKLIGGTRVKDDESAARLLNEAAAVGRLEHPNIVMLLGTRRLGDRELALILQYVPGITLAERIRTSRAMPYAEVERILTDLGRALSYAHRRGVFHGDLRPVHVQIDGETGRARLAGFGMGGAVDFDEPSDADVEERSDVLGLGLVGYEMLTGEAPWGDERPDPLTGQEVLEDLEPLSERCPGVPRRIRNAVEGALRPDPDERWSDADAFLAALGAGATDGDVAKEHTARKWTPRPGRDESPHTGADPKGGRRASGSGREGRPAGAHGPPHDPRSWPPYEEVGAWSPPPGGSRSGRVTRVLEVLVFGILFLVGGIALVHPEPERLLASALLHLGLAGSAVQEPSDPWESEAPFRGEPVTGEDADPRPGGAEEFGFEASADQVGEGVPHGMIVVGGRSRIGAPGLPLFGPVVVRVVDEHGVGIPGVEVSFDVTAGDGSAEPARGMSGPGGAVSTSWTLGPGEGTQTLRAGVVGSDGPNLATDIAAQATLERAGAAPTGDPGDEQPAPEEADTEEGALDPARIPAAVEVIRGANQEAGAGTPLADPLEVRITDEDGRPVPDAVVHFQVTAGGGAVSPSVTSANAEGVARAAWTLGSEGRQEVRAYLEASPSMGVQFSAGTSAPRLLVRTAVAAGGTHSCFLRSNGTLSCWGANESGQLGDGSRNRRIVPGAGVGGGPFALVAAGVSHTCALDTSGRLACWGLNGSGQLGDGSTTPRSSPVPVSGERAYRTVSAGGSHTCALAEDGGAYCWGANDRGQLGDGSTVPRATPVRVEGSSGFRQLVTGWRHTCALDQAGTAHCWGSNESGEAGLVTGELSPTPRAVLGGQRFTSLAAGNAHTCGVTEEGEIHCWGANGSGQLGDGTRRGRPTPSPVSDSGPFVGVVAGGIHSCGLTSDGTVRCWGGNVYGQLGDGSTTDRSTPVPVGGGARFAQLHAFGSHTCGRTSDEQVLCWGYNLEGQLGDGTRENRTGPTPVAR